MDQFAQQLVNGLTIGSLYALIAVGYTVVYGIVQLINFAHGEVFMIGAFGALTTYLLLFQGQTALWILPILVMGAVAASVLPKDKQGHEGTYVDYIGVHRLARGRGVAKSLLHAVIADTARRGRNRVALEVDADSPTGADGLYESMGWVTRYRTESWHRDVRFEGTDAPVPQARLDQ